MRQPGKEWGEREREWPSGRFFGGRDAEAHGFGRVFVGKDEIKLRKALAITVMTSHRRPAGNAGAIKLIGVRCPSGRRRSAALSDRSRQSG